MRNAGTLIACALLAGCAVGPNYREPVPAVAASFDGARGSARYGEGAVAPQFWTALGDPLLDELVATALVRNHDARIALANLVEARALARESLFDFLPTVTASGGRTKRLLSSAEAPGVTRANRESNLYDARFDAFWELDLFGGVRRRSEAARAQARAIEAGWQFTQVTVAAEVTRAYLELRGVQAQLDVATRNAENQSGTLRLTEVRLRGGRGTELDRARASAQLLTTRAAIPLLEASVRTTSYRLGVLTGQSPEALLERLAAAVPLPALPESIALDTPADLLRRRPDVRSAERRLAAATAREGVAIADFLPSISFVGQAGGLAARSGDLTASGAERYAFGPRLDWAFLDLGRVRERFVQSRAGAARALAEYEQAVVRALEDADGALVRYDRARAREAYLADAARESATAAALARRRFEGGVSDFLPVLDAERTQLEAEDRHAQSRTDAATALVAVYKAFAGGGVPP